MRRDLDRTSDRVLDTFETVGMAVFALALAFVIVRFVLAFGLGLTS